MNDKERVGWDIEKSAPGTYFLPTYFLYCPGKLTLLILGLIYKMGTVMHHLPEDR